MLESLYDEEDREYMKSVYNKMIEIGIVEKTEGEVRGNRTVLLKSQGDAICIAGIVA
ncbi:MAG: hypothetical protein ACLTZM_19060 [Ruminococcus sp.]